MGKFWRQLRCLPVLLLLAGSDCDTVICSSQSCFRVRDTVNAVAPEGSLPPVEAASSIPLEGPEAPNGRTTAEIVRAPIGPFIEPRESLPSLNTILEKTARLASLYLGKALSFTSVERTEVFTYYRGFERSWVAPEVVYCFYNTEHGRLDDLRIEKSRMARLKKRLARGEDVSADLLAAPDPLRNNTAVPAYVVRPYTWLVLFSREAQAEYRYKIEGVDKEGVWVSLEPAGPDPDPTSWYGDVLIDLATYQILEAQGYQHESIGELRRARAMLESDDELPPDEIGRTFVEMHIRTDFRRTAHGIRLPSKVSTEIYHHTIVQPVSRRYIKKQLAYRIVQKHRKYEFFGVRVRERIADVTAPSHPSLLRDR